MDDQSTLSHAAAPVQVLKHRMEVALQAGRNVVLAGDLNIAPYPIDHCDLVRASRAQQEAMLTGRPDRAWFRNALQTAEGPFVDLFRCALVSTRFWTLFCNSPSVPERWPFGMLPMRGPQVPGSNVTDILWFV